MASVLVFLLKRLTRAEAQSFACARDVAIVTLERFRNHTALESSSSDPGPRYFLCPQGMARALREACVRSYVPGQCMCPRP